MKLKKLPFPHLFLLVFLTMLFKALKTINAFSAPIISNSDITPCDRIFT